MVVVRQERQAIQIVGGSRESEYDQRRQRVRERGKPLLCLESQDQRVRAGTHLFSRTAPAGAGECPQGQERATQGVGEAALAGSKRRGNRPSDHRSTPSDPLPGGSTMAQSRREPGRKRPASRPDRKSTRLNSSHSSISYAVFCLK